MFETSHINLKKAALKNNLSFIQNLIGEDCKMSSVVKGKAYGHGIEEYVVMAEECGVNHFSVYSTDEAQRVFNVKNTNTSIMIMGSVDDDGLAWAIDNDIEVWVFDEERLNKALQLAENLRKKAKLHIEIETGMYRTGFENGEIKNVIQTLQGNLEHHTLVGICTHFASAESISNYYRIKEQIKRFKRVLKQFEKATLHPVYRHACCSAALLRFPEMRMDMVRVGILQYGFWPSTETFIDYTQKNKTMDEPLHRIISWKSHVMSVKHVKTGEYIGYGTSYLAQSDTKIGIVPVGYGHGFARSLSNQGRALINGIRMAVIGTVNMNSLAVDLSEVESVKKGDSVTLIGRDGELDVSVASFSEATNQLNYELLTRLPMHIPRIVV